MKLITCVAAIAMAAFFMSCEKNDDATSTTEGGESSTAPGKSDKAGVQSTKSKAQPEEVIPPKHDGPIETHPFAIQAAEAWKRAVKAVEGGDKAALNECLTPGGRLLASRGSGWTRAFFQGATGKPVEVNGGRVALQLTGPRAGSHVVGLYRQGKVLLDPLLSRRYRVTAAKVEHPMNRTITLKDATAGLKGAGQLRMKITTSKGDINCKLYEEVAPLAVANFVGLARGLRAFKLPTEESWTKRRFFTGLAFHRIVPGKTIQSGCPNSDGRGGPGFSFDDEFDLSVRHASAGMLGLLNGGPHSNGSQFYITAGQMPKYDDKHTIFGECAETSLVKSISQADTVSFGKPKAPVAINGLEFYRKP